jgi:hypothetical protein
MQQASRLLRAFTCDGLNHNILLLVSPDGLAVIGATRPPLVSERHSTVTSPHQVDGSRFPKFECSHMCVFMSAHEDANEANDRLLGLM